MLSNNSLPFFQAYDSNYQERATGQRQGRKFRDEQKIKSKKREQKRNRVQRRTREHEGKEGLENTARKKSANRKQRGTEEHHAVA